MVLFQPRLGLLRWPALRRRVEDGFAFKADFPALFAAICVRLANSTRRAVVANALKAGTQLSIATEGFWPQIEPDRTAYLNDLRAAGVPEN